MNNEFKIKHSVELNICRVLALFLFIIFILSFILTYSDGLIPFLTYDYELLDDDTYAIKNVSNGKYVKKAILPSTYLGKPVSTIKSGAFEAKSRLEEIIVPKSVKVIESRAFYGCENLVKLDLGSVEKIGGSAFAKCSSLKEVVIPGSVKEIGDYAFSDCFRLESVIFNAIECQDLTSSSNLFKGCAESGLRVEIGKDVKRVPAYIFTSSYKTWDRNKESAYRAAYEYEVAGAQAYGLYVGNPNINIMSFEQYVLNKFSYNVYSTLNVTEVVFAQDSQCKEIGARAFYKTMIEHITFPKSLTAIGAYAVGDCERIGEIIFEDARNWQAVGNEIIDVDFTDEGNNVNILLKQYDNYKFQKSE